MLRKALIVLAAAASVGLLAPEMAQARGMGGHGMGGHWVVTVWRPRLWRSWFRSRRWLRRVRVGPRPGLWLLRSTAIPITATTTRMTAAMAVVTSCASASTPATAGASGRSRSVADRLRFRRAFDPAVSDPHGGCKVAETLQPFLADKTASVVDDVPPAAALEEAGEKADHGLPGRDDDRKAGSHRGDSALKKNAAGAGVQIGRGIAHACKREVQKSENQQGVFCFCGHARIMCAANQAVNHRTRPGIVNFISFDFNIRLGNAIATVGYFLRAQSRADAVRGSKLIGLSNVTMNSRGEFIMSTEDLLTPDVVGLTRVAPFSRRGFMTASAAVTAGYTLAAGPVRADVITTDTAWPRCGRREDKSGRWRDARLFRAPERRQPIRRSCWWRWRFSDCTNTSRT